MATIYLSLSSKADSTKKHEVLIRFSHGKINQRAKTNIFIPSDNWNETDQQITIPNNRIMNDETKELKQYLIDQNEKLNALTTSIQTLFNGSDKNSISNDWLKTAIEKYNFPENNTIQQLSFFDLYKKFITDIG